MESDGHSRLWWIGEGLQWPMMVGAWRERFPYRLHRVLLLSSSFVGWFFQQVICSGSGSGERSLSGENPKEQRGENGRLEETEYRYEKLSKGGERKWGWRWAECGVGDGWKWRGGDDLWSVGGGDGDLRVGVVVVVVVVMVTSEREWCWSAGGFVRYSEDLRKEVFGRLWSLSIWSISHKGIFTNWLCTSHHPK